MAEQVQAEVVSELQFLDVDVGGTVESANDIWALLRRSSGRLESVAHDSHVLAVYVIQQDDGLTVLLQTALELRASLKYSKV